MAGRMGGLCHGWMLRNRERMVELQAEQHRREMGICLDKARVKGAQEAGIQRGTRIRLLAGIPYAMMMEHAQVGGIQLLAGIQRITLAAGPLMAKAKVGGVHHQPGMKWALGFQRATMAAGILMETAHQLPRCLLLAGMMEKARQMLR